MRIQPAIVNPSIPTSGGLEKTSDILAAIRSQTFTRPLVPTMATQNIAAQSQIVIPQPVYVNTSYNAVPPFRQNMKHAVIAYHIYFNNEYELDLKEMQNFESNQLQSSGGGNIIQTINK